MDWNIGNIQLWEVEWLTFIWKREYLFFPMFNYSFFEHCRLTQSFARIPDDNISQRIRYSYGKNSTFQNNMWKVIYYTFFTLLLHLPGFPETHYKCVPQWQEFWKHIFKKQLIFIAQNQNYLTFTWWIQSPFHLALYNL